MLARAMTLRGIARASKARPYMDWLLAMDVIQFKKRRSSKH